MVVLANRFFKSEEAYLFVGRDPLVSILVRGSHDLFHDLICRSERNSIAVPNGNVLQDSVWYGNALPRFETLDFSR